MKKKIELKKIVWIVLLFLLSIGQLQRIQLTNRIAFYLHDILISGWVLWAIINKKINLKKYQLIIVFLSWAFISLLLNNFLHGWQLRPFLYFARLIVYLLFGASLSGKKNLQTILIGSGFFVAVLGWIMYLLMPDSRHLGMYGWDNHYFRLIGPFLDPNFTGLILSLSFVYLFQQFSLLKTIKNKIFYQKIFLLINYTVIFSAILFTYSRSSYLSFLIGLFFLGWQEWLKHNKKQLALIISLGTLFLICLPFLPRPGGEGVNLTRTSTAKTRIHSNQSVLDNMATKDWIIGKGLFVTTINQQAIDKPMHASFPDNIIVFLLTSTGIVGLGMAGIILLKFYLLNWKEKIKLAQLNMVLAHSLFNLSLFEPFTLLFLLIYFSLNRINSNE